MERTVIDTKSESLKMLSLMNVVIKEREVKALKKREVKFVGKQGEMLAKSTAQDDAGPSLVDSIFRPQSDAFKG
jgi:hypothetical protein